MNSGVKRTFAIALGGMLAALSIVLMFFAMLFPFAQLVLPAMAGILLVCAVFEMGEGWAFLIFVAVGILSLLLPSSKDAAIYYIFFFAHYPIIKSFLEKIKNKPLKWAAKLVIFNACVWAALFVSIKLMGIPGDVLKYGYLVTAVLLNVTFIIYDIAVTRLILLYNYRIRKIIGRKR
jgi:hypothetical protein